MILKIYLEKIYFKVQENFNENQIKFYLYNYNKFIPLNERVRDMIISKDKKIIIMFLETTSSLAVLRKKQLLQ